MQSSSIIQLYVCIPVLPIFSSSPLLLWRWGRHSLHSPLLRWWWLYSWHWRKSSWMLPGLHRYKNMAQNDKSGGSWNYGWSYNNESGRGCNRSRDGELPELGLAMSWLTWGLFRWAYRWEFITPLRVSWGTIIRFWTEKNNMTLFNIPHQNTADFLFVTGLKQTNLFSSSNHKQKFDKKSARRYIRCVILHEVPT